LMGTSVLQTASSHFLTIWHCLFKKWIRKK